MFEVVRSSPAVRHLYMRGVFSAATSLTAEAGLNGRKLLWERNPKSRLIMDDIFGDLFDPDMFGVVFQPRSQTTDILILAYLAGSE